MVSTNSSNNWDCLVDQLNTIDALGDVYEKKKRLRRIIVQLDALYEGIRDDVRSDPMVGCIDPVDVKRVLDKAKQDEKDIQIAEDELEDTERRVPVNLEVVGDIDDLLGGLTLGDGDNDGPSAHVQETAQRRPVTGRRYKKVVRASGKQRQHLPARQDIDDDTGSVDGDHAGMPTRDDDDTTDEEAKRYAVPASGRTRLTVDIPIQHEVIAQAQRRDPIMAGHDRGSSGSTHAHCGVRHVQNTDGVSSSYDSDDSITSPAAGAIRTVVTNTK